MFLDVQMVIHLMFIFLQVQLQLTPSNYKFTLNRGPKKCVCNFQNSTIGWVNGTAGETTIGNALFGNPLASFKLSVNGGANGATMFKHQI